MCLSITRPILGLSTLAVLGDTQCEDFERALVTNVLGPFRLTKALLGSLAASAREGKGALVLNITSDAGVNAYPQWGSYGASKAALAHMTRVWNEELSAQGVVEGAGHAERHARSARCSVAAVCDELEESRQARVPDGQPRPRGCPLSSVRPSAEFHSRPGCRSNRCAATNPSSA